jgi:hypothetical protein
VTQDPPSAAQLLESIAEFLVGEVRDWAPQERRFQVLVAANLCVVLARELRAGDEPLQADLELYADLLGEPTGPVSDAGALRGAVRDAQGELARRIRSGELDGRLDELTERLREHVRRKLDVARPGYADGD